MDYKKKYLKYKAKYLALKQLIGGLGLNDKVKVINSGETGVIIQKNKINDEYTVRLDNGTEKVFKKGELKSNSVFGMLKSFGKSAASATVSAARSAASATASAARAASPKVLEAARRAAELTASAARSAASATASAARSAASATASAARSASPKVLAAAKRASELAAATLKAAKDKLKKSSPKNTNEAIKQALLTSESI